MYLRHVRVHYLFLCKCSNKIISLNIIHQKWDVNENKQAFYYILFFDFFVNCHNVLLYNKLLLCTCNWQKRCVLNFHNKQISIKINLTSSGRTVSTSNKNDIWCGFPPNLQNKTKSQKKII